MPVIFGFFFFVAIFCNGRDLLWGCQRWGYDVYLVLVDFMS